MTYIYDILLNFNEEYFDFYDWNKNDKIIHIKKIPIYKVNEQDLINIFNNHIKFDSLFLDGIKDKTEVFLKHEVKKLKYSCLLCANEKIVAINIDLDGYVIGVSDLLIDEYSEIIDNSKDFKSLDVKYIIGNNKKIEKFKTRKDKYKENFILKELKKFNDEELKYIYYEMYLENENEKKKILERLASWPDRDSLYNLIKYISEMYKKIK